jgi:hypothetical protein
MFCALTRAAALLRFVDSDLSVQAQVAEQPTAARIRNCYRTFERSDVRLIERDCS